MLRALARRAGMSVQLPWSQGIDGTHGVGVDSGGVCYYIRNTHCTKILSAVCPHAAIVSRRASQRASLFAQVQPANKPNTNTTRHTGQQQEQWTELLHLEATVQPRISRPAETSAIPARSL